MKQCQKLKPSLAVVVTGIGCNDSKADFGTTCLHNCKLGYNKVSGSKERVCQADQKWSGSDITCVGMSHQYLNYFEIRGIARFKS